LSKFTERLLQLAVIVFLLWFALDFYQDYGWWIQAKLK